MTRTLSAAEFAAIRTKAQAAAQSLAIEAAKVRITVNRKPKPEPDYYDGAPPVKVWPGSVAGQRVMALDLSMAKTGLAWGKAGDKPEGTLTLTMPKEFKDKPEGERLEWMASAIVSTIKKNGCGTVIFSEFYNSSFMLSFRANVSLRGTVMALLVAHGIEARGVAEVTARKAVGVDTRRKQEGEKGGFMKVRAKETLKKLGLGHLGEDEGDAAILLMGAKAVLPVQVDPSKYDMTLFN